MTDELVCHFARLSLYSLRAAVSRIVEVILDVYVFVERWVG